MNNMKGTMSDFGSTALGAFLIKMGGFKLLGAGAALLGAGIMAIFRPPKDRKELFKQGAVALGCSFLFGSTAVNLLDWAFDSINLATAPVVDVVNFNIAVHGLVGALSWGIFGGILVLRDKFSKDPVGTAKEIKDVATR